MQTQFLKYWDEMVSHKPIFYSQCNTEMLKLRHFNVLRKTLAAFGFEYFVQLCNFERNLAIDLFYTVTKISDCRKANY